MSLPADVTPVNVRRAWQKIVGFTEEEIDYQLAHDPPESLSEELSQYHATVRIHHYKENKWHGTT